MILLRIITDSITVHEIVKQGTIFGPKLCSVATEKINGIGEEISHQSLL